MAGDNPDDLHSKIQQNCYPINRMTEELTSYLEKTGVIAQITDVLRLLYEMDEKPVDPLEFMRTNMAEVVPETMELTKLEEEYDTVMQEIDKLQQENISMTNRLKELETNQSDNIAEMNSNENTVIGFSDNDNIKMQGSAEKYNEK